MVMYIYSTVDFPYNTVYHNAILQMTWQWHTQDTDQILN